MAAALIAAVTLAGCVGPFTSSIRNKAQLMWVPCPDWNVGVPSWSPDGTRIGIAIEKQPPHHSLYLIDPDSGAMERLATVQAAYRSSLHPLDWSLDGSELLYAYNNTSYNYNLAAIDRHGGVRLVMRDLPGAPGDYAWSPDGQHIVFFQRGQGNPARDLHLINRSGEIQWRLSALHPGVRLTSSPAWSPDGTSIAFVSGDSDGYRLAVISADGSRLDWLVSDEPFIGEVSWSPDGRWIAYAVHGVQSEINIIHPDGTGLRRLTGDSPRDIAWLPDTASALYFANEVEIAAVSLAGGLRTVHTALPMGASAITFSPDATRVAYVAQHGLASSDDLFVMNIDGTDVQQLTRNPGNRRCFQWPFG